MEEEEIDILEFLLSSEFNDIQYSEDQYIYFLKKYQKFYKLLNAKYHGVKKDVELSVDKTKKLEDKILALERVNIIDKAKVSNMSKELKKKLTIKERLFGKLIGRFNPDNI